MKKRGLTLVLIGMLLLPLSGCIVVAAGAAGWVTYKGIEQAVEKSREDKERLGEYLAETSQPIKVDLE